LFNIYCVGNEVFIYLVVDLPQASTFNTYEARDGRSTAEREAALSRQLQGLVVATQLETLKTAGVPLDVLFCTEFNRHHELWGGLRASYDKGRRNEGEPFVDLIQELGLQSLLPAGTITREHQSRDIASTVDVLVGSGEIAEYLEYCCIHHTDYWSDHRPITLSYCCEYASAVYYSLLNGRKQRALYQGLCNQHLMIRCYDQPLLVITTKEGRGHI
jgi:hypothetical protein